MICFIAFNLVVYSLERYANGGRLTTSYEFLHTNVLNYQSLIDHLNYNPNYIFYYSIYTLSV